MAVKKRWLNRKTVVQTAVNMANEAGDARALTLAALARELNVRTPSLYNHIEGIDDLHYGMAVYAARRLVKAIQQQSSGLMGREALIAAAVAYRDFAHRQPGIYALTLRAPEDHEEELIGLARTLLQLLLLMLASLGLDGDEALHAVRGLRAILHGFVSLEAAEGFKLSLDREESFQRLLNAFLDGLGRDG